MVSGLSPRRAPCARSLTASASPSSTSLMSRTPARMPAAKSPRAELRQDRVLDDELRHGVGHDRLEPAADLDAHLALVRRDDEQDAVVLALLADAPLAAELIAVVLDRVALQRVQRDDGELVGRLLLRARRARRRCAVRSPAFSRPASSVMRPVSCGNVGSACAAPAQRQRQQQPQRRNAQATRDEAPRPGRRSAAGPQACVRLLGRRAYFCVPKSTLGVFISSARDVERRHLLGRTDT